MDQGLTKKQRRKVEQKAQLEKRFLEEIKNHTTTCMCVRSTTAANL